MKVVISKEQQTEVKETLTQAGSAHKSLVRLCVEIAGCNGIMPGPAAKCSKEEKDARHQLYKRLVEVAETCGTHPSTVSRAMSEADLRYKVSRQTATWTPSVNAGRIFVKLLEFATIDKKIGEDLCKLIALHDMPNRLHVTKTAIELRDTKGNTTGRILLQAGKYEVVTKTGKATQADKTQADKITGEQVPSITPGNVSEDVKRVRAAVA